MDQAYCCQAGPRAVIMPLPLRPTRSASASIARSATSAWLETRSVPHHLTPAVAPGQHTRQHEQQVR